MKKLAILFTPLLILLFIVNVIGCANEESIPPLSPTPSPTQTPIPTPTPTPTLLSGQGIAQGRVLFTDGLPAFGAIVYILKVSETSFSVIAHAYVDKDGYYSLILPVGQYELYVESYPTHLFGAISDAGITVVEYETTSVRTLSVLRNISVSTKGEYLTTTQPSFSWEAVPNATYYLVKVRAQVNVLDSGGYEKEIQVSNTQLTWSELALGRYGVQVDAYDAQNELIGSGYESFQIGPNP